MVTGYAAVLGQGREQSVYPKSESILLLYRLSRRQNQTMMLSASYIIIEQSSTHDRICAVAPESFRRKRVCSQLLFRV